jgi:Holliday junction resolvase RusA-like endonuclease
MMPAKAKARPRVTANGTHMPKEYSQWKRDFAWLARQAMVGKRFVGNVDVIMTFHKDSVNITIMDSERPRFGRSDIDNLAGGVLDALQDGGLIMNDNKVVELHSMFGEGK